MFQPGGSLTRAMFVTILGRMAGAEEESGESGFADVPAGRWYSAYVAWAAGEGIVDGTGNGCFSPNSPVTREQMATMIARYVDSAGLTLPETGDPAAPFTDRNAVSDWAEAGVELMRQTGILAGYEDGTFQPQRTANRAEAATIFMRLEQVIGGEELPGGVVRAHYAGRRAADGEPDQQWLPTWIAKERHRRRSNTTWKGLTGFA